MLVAGGAAYLIPLLGGIISCNMSSLSTYADWAYGSAKNALCWWMC